MYNTLCCTCAVALLVYGIRNMFNRTYISSFFVTWNKTRLVLSSILDEHVVWNVAWTWSAVWRHKPVTYNVSTSYDMWVKYAAVSYTRDTKRKKTNGSSNSLV